MEHNREGIGIIEISGFSKREDAWRQEKRYKILFSENSTIKKAKAPGYNGQKFLWSAP